MANHRLPTRRTRRALAWATVALTGLGGGIILPHTAAFGSTQEGGSAGVSDLSCEGFTLYVSGWPQDQQGFAGVNGKSTPFVGGVTIPVTTYQTTPKHYYVSVSVNGETVFSEEFDTGPCDGPTPTPDPTTASPTPDPTTASPTPDPTPASPTPSPTDLCTNIDGVQRTDADIAALPGKLHRLENGTCVPNEPDTAPNPNPAPAPPPAPNPGSGSSDNGSSNGGGNSDSGSSGRSVSSGNDSGSVQVADCPSDQVQVAPVANVSQQEEFYFSGVGGGG